MKENKVQKSFVAYIHFKEDVGSKFPEMREKLIFSCWLCKKYYPPHTRLHFSNDVSLYLRGKFRVIILCFIQISMLRNSLNYKEYCKSVLGFITVFFPVLFQPIVLKKNNETISYDEAEPKPNCYQPAETIKGQQSERITTPTLKKSNYAISFIE